ncbi:MAG: glucose-6-phosphate isomerase [Campylobacteraceae bacterium]|jgi:glucose-6-phosphate isomerase|nr:glucose-6-phosphate isomerase [Campylobacteraceae bacterium]
MFTNNFYFQPVACNLLKKFKDRVDIEYHSHKIGYYHLPDDGIKTIKNIKNWQNSLENIDSVVVIGVGGSSLGAKALSSMLNCEKKLGAPNLFFLENIDPIAINAVISKIKFSKTLFLIISKSGTTLDTISITKIIMERFKTYPQSQEFKNRFAVITDENSVLHKFADTYGLKSFFVPQNTGGRFSVLSAVGLVPLTLCGFNTEAILEGAAQCKNSFFEENDMAILQKAYAYVNAKEDINVLFSYSNAFKEFNEWYIQLWAESLGKKKGSKNIGFTPVGLIGAIDQHSFLQLIIDGPKDKSVTFIRIKEMKGDMSIPDFSLKYIEKVDLKSNVSAVKLLNEQALATMKSVINGGIMVDEIILDKLDAYHAGYLIYYYELLTSACGAILGIDSYNQPGVEIGKKILIKKLGKLYANRTNNNQ